MIAEQLHVGLTVENERGTRGWIVDVSQDSVWLDVGELNSIKLDREEVERDFTYL